MQKFHLSLILKKILTLVYSYSYIIIFYIYIRYTNIAINFGNTNNNKKIIIFVIVKLFISLNLHFLLDLSYIAKVNNAKAINTPVNKTLINNNLIMWNIKNKTPLPKVIKTIKLIIK